MIFGTVLFVLKEIGIVLGTCFLGGVGFAAGTAFYKKCKEKWQAIKNISPLESFIKI